MLHSLAIISPPENRTCSRTADCENSEADQFFPQNLPGMDFEKSKSMRSGEDREEQESWRFTYEALTHVHSLRLFLFNSMVPVPWNCVSLQATLAWDSPISSSPVVLCEWISSEGDPCKLFVPLPVCLVDYSVPLAAFARSDHIEIKLKLLSSGRSFVEDLALLGYNYGGEPIERDGGVKADSAFSIASDAELLASKQGVTFYCRNCSAKLTNNSISCFRALPSTDWRELADHWFGVCCCRDGVKTNSMMARFEEFSTPTSGVCLVGSTTCVIHHDDLFGSSVGQNRHISGNDEAQYTSMTENDDEMRAADDLDVEMSFKGKNDGHVPLDTDLHSCIDEEKPLKNGCSYDTPKELADPASCCNGHENVVLDDCGSEKLPDHIVNSKTLANGFMSAFPCSKLTPFHCHNCAGLVGVFTGGKEDGLQLFKCHISSDLSTGGPLDIFRFHTLERVFSNELLSNAEEDSSYRYVVRDLSSRSPLLQLVLINNESWSCSGFCVGQQRPLSELPSTRPIAVEEVSISTELEDGANGTFSSQGSRLMTSPGNEKLCPVFLEPVMKVMFCDISSSSEDQLSEVESWGLKNQSDDIYMLDGEAKALARALQANVRLFPEFCAAFQQFSFSFLAR